jgi:hypothetical protein
MMTDERICALRAFLIADGEPTAYSDITESSCQSGLYDVCGGSEYLVLTDDEANEHATDDIMESIWAFNPDFIIDHTNLPYEAIDLIRSYQSEQCDGANDVIYALINDIDEFIDDAICADGRGHFMASYDGDEYESGEYFIYRMN